LRFVRCRSFVSALIYGNKLKVLFSFRVVAMLPIASFEFGGNSRPERADPAFMASGKEGHYTCLVGISWEIFWRKPSSSLQRKEGRQECLKRSYKTIFETSLFTRPRNPQFLRQSNATKTNMIRSTFKNLNLLLTSQLPTTTSS
jgi:hypothetical protein